jgi:hypothetical protein
MNITAMRSIITVATLGITIPARTILELICRITRSILVTGRSYFGYILSSITAGTNTGSQSSLV